MKASELLLRLKIDMKHYESKVRHDNNCLNRNYMSIKCIMSNYNLKNFNEILSLSPEGLDYEINDEELRDLENRIDHYFKLYAPDDEEFKKFTKIISIYLTFIAEKPLHPPGIEFSDGTRVHKEGYIYYCTGKKLHLKEDYSLCKYCVARNSNP